MKTDEEIKQAVRKTYGKAATEAKTGGSSCCTDSAIVTRAEEIGYSADELAGLPETVSCASLGCGNPTALGGLQEGEIVLDLGSGGGIDVFLAARRVGPQGRVYGLDMTEEMLSLAEENRRKLGVTNVEFLKGELENIPLPEGTVDVIISNCVVNLSADKDKALGEAYRVLKPGGRLAISDIVVRRPLPERIRKDVESWVGCVAGAMSDTEYNQRLTRAGFEGISIDTTYVYRVEDADLTEVRQMLDELSWEERESLSGSVTSCFIRATKPAQ
ncbi:MAG: arsenite methyltransferase [Chloroflexi bacterium]|nr:arsenite methyltransferase [Chloroflexota bacterium]